MGLVRGHHPQGHNLEGHLVNPTGTAQLLGEGSVRYPYLHTKPVTVVWWWRKVPQPLSASVHPVEVGRRGFVGKWVIQLLQWRVQFCRGPSRSWRRRQRELATGCGRGGTAHGAWHPSRVSCWEWQGYVPINPHGSALGFVITASMEKCEINGTSGNRD